MILSKKFKLFPPEMPNIVRYEKEAELKQDGFKVDQGFPIKDFTRDEAYEYAEFMKESFIRHWMRLKER